jgi:hypothetical protein
VKGHATANPVPYIVLSLAQSKIGIRTELSIVLSHVLERAYGHAQSLIDVHAMSRNLVQTRVIDLDKSVLSPFSLRVVSKEVSQSSTYRLPLADVVSD